MSRSSRFASGAGAVVLSLVMAAQVTAASWSPSSTLASAAATFVDGIATLADGTAVVVYVGCHDAQICYDVNVRRTTDGGQSWEPALTLGDGSFFASIAGRGSRVDVAWSESGDLMYARSTDSGASFGPSRRLATTGGATGIGRGPGGVVAVAWTASSTDGSIKARVSVDGGQSFGP